MRTKTTMMSWMTSAMCGVKGRRLAVQTRTNALVLRHTFCSHRRAGAQFSKLKSIQPHPRRRRKDQNMRARDAKARREENERSGGDALPSL